jgi:hypothetical protein
MVARVVMLWKVVTAIWKQHLHSLLSLKTYMEYENSLISEVDSLLVDVVELLRDECFTATVSKFIYFSLMPLLEYFR